MNGELPDVQAGFRKDRGTRHQIANICWIIEKAREFQKNIYFLFIDYDKAFDCVDHNKLWKILKEMGINVFLELSCFFDDPADVGNLMSGSSVFSKSSLNIWKFMVHILLKPGLENLKLNIQKTKIMASSSITSWQIDGKTMETVRDFIFLGSRITANDDSSHEIKRCLLLGRKALTNLAETLLCQPRSVQSKLWFFQWSCMDVRVGP